MGVSIGGRRKRSTSLGREEEEGGGEVGMEEEVVSLVLSRWSSAVKKHPPVEWTDVSDR